MTCLELVASKLETCTLLFITIAIQLVCQHLIGCIMCARLYFM